MSVFGCQLYLCTWQAWVSAAIGSILGDNAEFNESQMVKIRETLFLPSSALDRGLSDGPKLENARLVCDLD